MLITERLVRNDSDFAIARQSSACCVYDLPSISFRNRDRSSARWPLHAAFAEYVDMEMLYGLLSVLSCINDAAIAVI